MAKKSSQNRGKDEASSLRFTLKVREHGLEPILGAAYVLTGRAWVRLSGRRDGAITVSLEPKQASPKALAEAFEAELASQKIRWEIAKNNQPIREFIAEQAVLLANMPPQNAVPQAPATEPLTADQKAEIDRLIAEVEEEVRALNAAQDSADPHHLKATWEEKHGG